MGGIGVITNPRSRLNRRNPRLARQLAYILGEKGSVEQPIDLESLRRTAEGFRGHGIDVLCISGGDGTIHRVLTAMVQAYDGAPLPKFALLRGGTMNTIAHGLGIVGRPSELLDEVVSRWQESVPIPTARRWSLHVDDQQYGFLFGNGLIASFLEAYYEGAEPTPMKAVWLLARGIGSTLVGGTFARRLTSPWTGQVVVDGEAWPRRPWLTVGAGGVDDLGFGFRPFYLAPRHPGRMHVVGVGCSIGELVANLPRIRLARPIVADAVESAVAEGFELRSEGPIPYMIDGDFHRGGQTLRVGVGPPVDFVLRDG